MPELVTAPNLYVHFPFCRGKCAYCSLYSRVGATPLERADYVARLASHMPRNRAPFSTIYFGGGSPALCRLAPLAIALRPLIAHDTEFTVELHPLDVTADTVRELQDLGVNRISLGVQSLDDAILNAMGRGYDAAFAVRAFARIKSHFDNAGIDLIVGYPGERDDLEMAVASLRDWGLRHCSVYALQNERRLANAPDDATTLDRLARVGAALGEMGLKRYEISNYAAPGFECRHNFAVWRGEDYIGLGEGACGRLGRVRTRHFGTSRATCETLSPKRDALERTIFRLRTREGLDARAHPEWRDALAAFVREGLLTANGEVYVLTPRGTEVCDAILAELV